MLDIVIEESKDAARLATLNKPVQTLHFERYPEYFKKYSYDDVLAFFTEQLKLENWHSYIVMAQGVDIGYALFFERQYIENPFRKAYKGIQIDQICIEEKYRRHGIGKRLLEKVNEYARSIDATQIELTYWEKNIEAKDFYAQNGFETNINFVVRKL